MSRKFLSFKRKFLFLIPILLLILTAIFPNASFAQTSSSSTDVAIDETSSVKDSKTNKVKKTFSTFFIAGPSTRKPTGFKGSCPGGEVTDTNELDNKFECWYPVVPAPADYFVTATAFDNAGDIVSGPQGAGKKVTVTGIEPVVDSSNPKNSAGLPTAVIGFLSDVLNIVIGFLQEIIFFIFWYLLAPLIQAMLSIHTYTDTFVAVIYPGWEIVRNLCNMLFILAIIVIGLGTLFRVESYQYKHLLVKLIVAALTINFSLVIGQAILGFADTIQAQFLPANVRVIRSLAGDLMVSNWREAVLGNDEAWQSYSSGFASFVTPFFYLALSLGTFMVFAALAAFLVIRIIMLWILLLLSPIAFACGVLPSTTTYRTKWWGEFLKYAFFTPIMAFFINLTAVISNSARDNPILKSISEGSLDRDLGGSDFGYFVIKVTSNILLLVFLVAGLKVAQIVGVYGADGIISLAQKGTLAPFAIGAGYLGRRYNEATAKYIRGSDRKVSLPRAVGFAVANPKAFLKGWQKESEEKKHRASALAESAGLEVVQQRFASPKALIKGGYKILPHVLQHEKQEEDEKTKFLANMSRENVAKTAAEYFKLGDDLDGKAYKRSVIKLAMSKGYIDDIVELAHTTKEGQEMIKFMKANGLIDEKRDTKEYDVPKLDEKGHAIVKKDASGKEMRDEDGDVMYETEKVQGLKYNNFTRRALYGAMFGGKDGQNIDHAAARLITEEGETEGMNTGHLEYMTDMYFNGQTGHYEFYNIDKETGRSEGEAKMAGAEIAKRDSRRQATIAWHSLMSTDGKYFSEDIFKKVSKAVSENPGWMQERSANMLVAGTLKESELKPIREKFMKDGNLDFSSLGEERSKIIEARLTQMRKVDQRAFVSIVSRFINDASPQAVDARIVKGFQVNGNDQDLDQAKKIVLDKKKDT